MKMENVPEVVVFSVQSGDAVKDGDGGHSKWFLCKMPIICPRLNLSNNQSCDEHPVGSIRLENCFNSCETSIKKFSRGMKQEKKRKKTLLPLTLEFISACQDSCPE